jgi:hypothetical protein
VIAPMSIGENFILRLSRFEIWPVGASLKGVPDETLESAGEMCARTELLCGALVALGVILEFVIAVYHPNYDSFLDRWGTAFADLGVAFGVAGEIYFSSRSHNFSGELIRRSNERLAQVTEAAAWRVLSVSSRAKLTQSLKESGKMGSIEVHVFSADVEARNYAAQIAASIRAADWQCRISYESYSGPILEGVRLPVREANWNRPVEEVQGLLAGALAEAGVGFWGGSPSKVEQSTHSGHQLNCFPIGAMYVGPKPMPTFQIPPVD